MFQHSSKFSYLGYRDRASVSVIFAFVEIVPPMPARRMSDYRPRSREQRGIAINSPAIYAWDKRIRPAQNVDVENVNYIHLSLSRIVKCSGLSPFRSSFRRLTSGVKAFARRLYPPGTMRSSFSFPAASASTTMAKQAKA